jgi:hypothetical protein
MFRRPVTVRNLVKGTWPMSAEAAQLLRGLVDEVASLRRTRFPDGGVTEDFARAADHFYRLLQSGVMEEFINATRRLPLIRARHEACNTLTDLAEETAPRYPAGRSRCARSARSAPQPRPDRTKSPARNRYQHTSLSRH